MGLSFAETAEFIKVIEKASGIKPEMMTPEKITDLALITGITGGAMKELIAHVLWMHLHHSMIVELLRDSKHVED